MMQDDNMQGWAYQQELEHQQWLSENNPDSPDDYELENYADKHGS